MSKSFAASSRLVVLMLVLAGCARDESPSSASASAASGASGPAPQKPAAGTAGTDDDDPLPPLGYESALPEALRAMIGRPFTGDLDGMESRRMIRVGVTFNRTHYFVDKGTQRGLTFAYLKRFEDHLNTARKTRNLRIHVVPVPLQRDRLLRALTAGQIDAVAAQWTITPEREQLVDFSAPYRRNVSEIVVTAPGVPAIGSVEDLSGREVFVRRSSSYAESLRERNRQLERDGRPPITLLDAPENLEDDDILEMVDAGLVAITVVDDYLAEFWSQIFTGMKVDPTLTLRTGGGLALAFRKNSPKLAAEVNEFIRRHAMGTEFGNVIARRYVADTRHARRATTGADREKFLALTETFRKYGDQYSLDYLLMMAKGYRSRG
jgi:membrane-bound lytic murein transglycosylase MltF